MSTLEDCHEPGVLLVLSRPTAPEHLPEVHAWYDTEHGPARLRLGEKYFLNGYRYRSIEDDRWLAIYDMKDLTAGSNKAYTSLRENRSSREQDVLKNKSHALCRQFLRLLTGSLTAREPAKSVCLARLSTQDVLRYRNSNVLSQTLKPYDCSRVRIFDVVDGTDIESRSSLLTVICDFDRELTSDECKNVKSTILRGANNATLKSAEFYTYHRAFSGDDYVPPPEVRPKSEKNSSDIAGLRERALIGD